MSAPMHHMISSKFHVIFLFLLLFGIGIANALVYSKENVNLPAYNDICVLSTCSPADLSNTSVVLSQCNKNNLTISGRCCVRFVNETSVSILGVDLSQCSIKDTSPLKPLTKLKWIVLEENPHLNDTDFEGLSAIEYLSLPPEFTCPGGDDAWENVTYDKRVTICRDELDTCVTQNITCPRHVSTCVNDGPGASLCLCDHNHHGYKCIRTSYFPYILFALSICGSTLIVSVFLWTTQRMRVKRKKER